VQAALSPALSTALSTALSPGLRPLLALDDPLIDERANSTGPRRGFLPDRPRAF
jgi:hypothetical protein